MISFGKILAHGPAEGRPPEGEYVPDFLVIQDFNGRLWSIGKSGSEAKELEGEAMRQLIDSRRARLQDPPVDWIHGGWVIACAVGDGIPTAFPLEKEGEARIQAAQKLIIKAQTLQGKDPHAALLLLDSAGGLANVDVGKVVSGLVSKKIGSETLVDTFKRTSK